MTLSITRNTEDGFDAFLEEFIEQGMEGNASYFTGTSKDDTMEGFIDLGRSFDTAATKVTNLNAWLDKRSDVKNCTMGKLTDAWYGPFEQQNETASST